MDFFSRRAAGRGAKLRSTQLLEDCQRGSISFLTVEDLRLGEEKDLPCRNRQLRSESAIEQRDRFLIFPSDAINVSEIAGGIAAWEAAGLPFATTAEAAAST